MVFFDISKILLASLDIGTWDLQQPTTTASQTKQSSRVKSKAKWHDAARRWPEGGYGTPQGRMWGGGLGGHAPFLAQKCCTFLLSLGISQLIHNGNAPPSKYPGSAPAPTGGWPSLNSEKLANQWFFFFNFQNFASHAWRWYVGATTAHYDRQSNLSSHPPKIWDSTLKPSALMA